MSSLQKYLEDLKKGRNVEKAAEALGIEGDPVAIDPLIERLVERVENPGRDPLAVQKLSEALGKLKAKKAVPTLLRLMDTANAPETFNKAVRALGRIGDSRAIDPLLKQLLEGSSIAAWVLGEFGAKRTVEPLIKALSDSDFKTRGNSAHALGVLGNKKAIEPLISVLTDNEKWVR